ncbi:sulfotransferase [Marinobacter sp. NFXS9]|uniref:sulfotransferase n=1 Tax=Marinobacter sp. NFXS9 TaxID=2818433 RepID=UPI0032DEDEB2
MLGMHRSGTSSLTGSLQQAGLVLGDVHTANPFNRKGNREHPELMALHESLLQANGGSWHNPPGSVEWTEPFISQQEAFCRRFAGVESWGFKDPRALIALEGWLSLFPDAKLVGTVRHPLAVARSLHSRDPALNTLEGYMQLWATYNRRLLAYWRDRQFPLVDFDEPDDEYLASVGRLMETLRLREGMLARVRRQGVFGAVKGSLGRRTEPFFDPALRSQRVEGLGALPPDIAELYMALKGAAKSW